MRKNDKPIFFFSSSMTKIFFKLTLLQGSHLTSGTKNDVCHVGLPHHGMKINKPALLEKVPVIIMILFPCTLSSTLSMPRATLLKTGVLFLSRAEKDL